MKCQQFVVEKKSQSKIVDEEKKRVAISGEDLKNAGTACRQRRETCYEMC